MGSKNLLPWVISASGIVAGLVSLFLSYTDFQEARDLSIQARALANGSSVTTVKTGNSVVESIQPQSAMATPKTEDQLLAETVERLSREVTELQLENDELKKRCQSHANFNQQPPRVLRRLINVNYQSRETSLTAQFPENSQTAFPIKNYLQPAIYGLLGVMLCLSAPVAVLTLDKGRRAVASEVTKTLITFFIGAATGRL